MRSTSPVIARPFRPVDREPIAAGDDRQRAGATRSFLARAAHAAGITVDRLLAIFSPRLAARHMGERATFSQIETFSNGIGGYDAGKLNRLTRGRIANRINENAVPLIQVERLRWQAYDVYRNNQHARKLIKTLEAKVVGRGLTPHSKATKASGKPHREFREAAQALWQESQRGLDYRGRASQGGQHGTELQKIALRSAVLSGDLLWHYKPLSRAQMATREAIVPTAIQLLHTERLAEYLTLTHSDQNPNNRVFRGIEIDDEGVVVAYWILRHHPTDPLMFLSVQQADRYEAREIGHCYIADDVDQFRGTTWLAPVLNPLRDAADYSYSELKAAALQACVAFWYKTPTSSLGAVPGIGVQMPSEWDLSDTDGNPITAMQPGMMLNMGHDGEFHAEGFQRNSTSAESWITYMLRSISTGVPGVKSSTITGDYRESSFSSERSADNDIWPELEGLQDWFSHGFCQPVYEQVIDGGFLAGWFRGIVTAEEFAARRGDFLRCAWQGPVARSINPVDDANAAGLRIQKGISTPQIEAAALGRDWHVLLKDLAVFMKRAKKEGIPEELIYQFLGVKLSNTTAGDDDQKGGADGGKKKPADRSPDGALDGRWHNSGARRAIA